MTGGMQRMSGGMVHAALVRANLAFAAVITEAGRHPVLGQLPRDRLRKVLLAEMSRDLTQEAMKHDIGIKH